MTKKQPLTWMIPPTSHSKYLGTWMKLMKADRTFIFRVAESAWDAAEFILSFSRKPLEVFSPPMKASGHQRITWSA